MSRFEDLSLIDPILRAVREEGYDRPTPIQQQTIRPVLDGRDVLGIAQTGTGKTAAFALPILQRLHGGQPQTRVLVLAPTRELATQISESFERYGRHTGVRSATVFGGVGEEPQIRALRAGVDVVVATPGRLLDLMNRKLARFDSLQVLVVDEADRMFDMGFIHDVRRIVSALPRKRQTLFFSATMPADIQSLAREILADPIRVEVTPSATTVEKITQSVYLLEKTMKFDLLTALLQDPAMKRVLVFSRTKRWAKKIADRLNRVGLRADSIHGDKGQTAREQALEAFRRGSCRILVATDIASRGIDVEDITHVVNFDLPNVPEDYVHRIGRTARAGAAGAAVTFCSPDERDLLADVERLIRMPITRRPVPPIRATAHPRPEGTKNRPGANARKRKARQLSEERGTPHHSPATGHRGNRGRARG